MARTLQSYVAGAWVAGSGKKSILVNPTTEEPLAETSTEGLDFAAAVAFAREQGGPALRSLTFAQRGELLRAMSRAIHAHRDELIELGIAERRQHPRRRQVRHRRRLGHARLLRRARQRARRRSASSPDGDGVQLGRTPRIFGQHVWACRATAWPMHINAFNFPAWGLAREGGLPPCSPACR